MFAGAALSYATVIEHWASNASFRGFFIELLAANKYRAFFWETPAVKRETLSQPFEFVLTDAPSLARACPAEQAFAAYFRDLDGAVAGFDNLGGDAYLLAPARVAAAQAYTHIGEFSRHAPVAQQHELWRRVGQHMGATLANEPVWLNTNGSGVAWLHVRFDSRPKYYRHQPYRALR